MPRHNNRRPDDFQTTLGQVRATAASIVSDERAVSRERDEALTKESRKRSAPDNEVSSVEDDEIMAEAGDFDTRQRARKERMRKRHRTSQEAEIGGEDMMWDEENMGREWGRVVSGAAEDGPSEEEQNEDSGVSFGEFEDSTMEEGGGDIDSPRKDMDMVEDTEAANDADDEDEED